MDLSRNVAELKEGRNGHAGLGFANERQEKSGRSKTSDSSISGLQFWPVLAEEALHGLPGEVVKTVEPHTVADPVAVLINMLVAFGNAIDQGAYFKVGSTFHHPKLFVALVGETSKARKGTPTNSRNLYYRSFKPILKGAGLPDIVFHELRHTCATIRFMKAQHPKRVSGLLGHSSVAFTLDKYSHIIPGLGDDDVMEEALS